MILLYGVESKQNSIQDNKKNNFTEEKLLEINKVQNRIVKFTKFLNNIDKEKRSEYQKILLSFLLILFENIENLSVTDNITKVENCIKDLRYGGMIKDKIIATIKESVYVNINSIKSEKNGYGTIPANILSIINFIFSNGCFINNDRELGEFVNKYHAINPLNMNKCSKIYELLVGFYFSVLPELKSESDSDDKMKEKLKNKDDRHDKMKEIIKKLKNKAINKFTESMKKYIEGMDFQSYQSLNDYINSKYKQKKILKENLKNINVIYEVLKEYKENKSDENFKIVLNSFKFDYHTLLRSVADNVEVPFFKEIKELIQKSLAYYGFNFENYKEIKEKLDSSFNSDWSNFSLFCEQNKKSLDVAKNSFDNFDQFYKFYLNIIKDSQVKNSILNKSGENLDIRKKTRKFFEIFTTGYQILNYNFESIKHMKNNLESIKINLSEDSELKEFSSQLQLILNECEMENFNNQLEDFIHQVEKTVKNNEIYSSNQNI